MSFNIILIPLDNRPVSYLLPQQIAGLNDNIKIFLPPRKYIGGLTDRTNVIKVLSWIDETLQNHRIDLIVCCLDTIAYGGLVPSRRCTDSEEEIKSRLDSFKNLVNQYKNSHNIKLYGFSSIMRISNNNVNEEEKEYWNQYGELLFQYSYLSHKIEEKPSIEDKEKLDNVYKQIPQDIFQDYINTRKRNLNINEYYLSWIQDNFLDYLVFSQDDTAQWGFNVQEGKRLSKLIEENNLTSKTTVKTGADEIPTDLVIQGLIKYYQERISIYPVFSTENGKNIISRYEDKTIYESAKGQIELCGAKIAATEYDADLILLVHTPSKAQNDIAMGIYDNPENEEAIKFCIDFMKKSNQPVILADIAYANGADNLLVQQLLAQGIDLNILYAYAGWNTTGNTLGSAISMGISRYIAEKLNYFNLENFKKLLLVRLADDWAYQSIVRQKIRTLTPEADEKLLDEELRPFIINLAKKVDLPLSKIELLFPWNRTFEVEINIL